MSRPMELEQGVPVGPPRVASRDVHRLDAGLQGAAADRARGVRPPQVCPAALDECRRPEPGVLLGQRDEGAIRSPSSLGAGHGEQPGLGGAGNALLGPGPQGAFESIGEGILGGCDVTRRRRQQGQDAPVAVARSGRGGDPGLLVRRSGRVGHGRCHSGPGSVDPRGRGVGPRRLRTWRPGTSPPRRGPCPDGGTSMTKTPARPSFVSAKGPSCIWTAPSRTVTVVVMSLRWSTSAATRTPADSSARPYAPKASCIAVRASGSISPSPGSRLLSTKLNRIAVSFVVVPCRRRVRLMG